MSYILEALKKAQAERQLGSAPDIHAPAPSHVPAPAAGASRKPLLLGLSAGIVIAGIAGVLAWRAQAPAPQVAVLASPAQGAGEVAMPAGSAAQAGATVAAPAAAPGAAVSAPPSVAGAPAPVATAPAPAAGIPTTPSVATAEPAPRALPAQAPARRQASTAGTAADPGPPARPASVASPAAGEAARSRGATEGRPAPAVRGTAAPVMPADTGAQAVYLPAPAPARAPDPAPPARAPEPVEENLRTLQQLPEAIQREVPRVSVGGYIYSPNPADRLLLVDKMLRREGEELAPGLVLERLMPKYAVMNYRGTRYRVAY